MYKICKTTQSAERQKQFQDTLLSMMEKQKYQDITVTSLCREMDVPRKAFYRYFETMEDVLHAAIDFTLQQAFLHLEVNPEIEKYFSFWKKEKRLLDILEKNEMSPELINRAYAMRINSSALNEFDENDIKHAGQISALMTMLVIWHHSGMKQTTKEMEEIAAKVFRENS